MKEQKTDIFEVTYEDLVQLVQDGCIDMNEFVLLQDDLIEDYENWKRQHHCKGTPEEAMWFLEDFEEKLYENIP